MCHAQSRYTSFDPSPYRHPTTLFRLLFSTAPITLPGVLLPVPTLGAFISYPPAAASNPPSRPHPRARRSARSVWQQCRVCGSALLSASPVASTNHVAVVTACAGAHSTRSAPAAVILGQHLKSQIRHSNTQSPTWHTEHRQQHESACLLRCRVPAASPASHSPPPTVRRNAAMTPSSGTVFPRETPPRVYSSRGRGTFRSSGGSREGSTANMLAQHHVDLAAAQPTRAHCTA